MPEDKKEKVGSWGIEDTIKSITTLIAVFGFLYGVYKYVSEKEREYRQKIYESQLELYKEVIDIASQISITPYDWVDSSAFIMNSKKFDEYYYGKMTLFEDTLVEKAMIDFKNIKDRYSVKDKLVSTQQVQDNCLNLGYACRSSLEHTWGLQLQELNRNK